MNENQAVAKREWYWNAVMEGTKEVNKELMNRKLH